MKAKQIYKLYFAYVLIWLVASIFTPDLVGPAILIALSYTSFWIGRFSKEFTWNETIFEAEIDKRKPKWGRQQKETTR